jgi:hypothetical protein
MDGKMKEFAQKQQKEKHRQQQYAKKREGEVIIDQTPGPKNKPKSSQGEYIDYVEVKD